MENFLIILSVIFGTIGLILFNHDFFSPDQIHVIQFTSMIMMVVIDNQLKEMSRISEPLIHNYKLMLMYNNLDNIYTRHH